MKNTFIAKKLDGKKLRFYEGKEPQGNLNSLYEAKYCTCDENTKNISEIPDWETAQDVSYIIDD